MAAKSKQHYFNAGVEAAKVGMQGLKAGISWQEKAFNEGYLSVTAPQLSTPPAEAKPLVQLFRMVVGKRTGMHQRRAEATLNRLTAKAHRRQLALQAARPTRREPFISDNIRRAAKAIGVMV